MPSSRPIPADRAAKLAAALKRNVARRKQATRADASREKNKTDPSPIPTGSVA